jgi:hypothetical protein
MFRINAREIAQLTDAERMKNNIERFIGEESKHIALMAARARHRAVRTATDRAENGQEEPCHDD